MRYFTLTLLTALLTASCGDSTAPAPLPGMWMLETVAGVQVPTTQSCDSIGVYGGTLNLRADQTYALVILYNAPSCGTHMMYVGSGGYLISADAVTLQGTSPNLRFVRDGNALTFTADNHAYVWRK